MTGVHENEQLIEFTPRYKRDQVKPGPTPHTKQQQQQQQRRK